MKKTILFLLVALGLIGHLRLQAQNLLQNGSFESSSIIGPDLNSILTQSIDGWTSSTDAHVAVLGIANSGNIIVYPQDEKKHLVLNQGNQAPNGYISQQVNLTQGNSYILSYWTVNEVGGFNSAGNGANVGANLVGIRASVVQQGAVTDSQIVFPQIIGQWVKNSLTFIATSNQATILFEDVSTQTISIDLGLDNIQLVEDSYLESTLPTNPVFYSSLAANAEFATALASTITSNPSIYGLFTGPEGPQGPTGVRGPQGPVGPQGIQGDAAAASSQDLLTNTPFLQALATNQVFLTALAQSLTTTNTSTNYGVASKLVQTLSFTTIPVQTYKSGKTITLRATSSAKLPITFTCSDPAIGTIQGNVLRLQGSGSATVTATQAGDPYNNPATATRPLVVR
jgi:hypothetical protein